MLESDPVWYEDVRVLARRYDEFFPARDQSPEERVNSIVRLLLYSSAAVYAYTRRARYAVFGVAAAALVSLAYKGSTWSRRGDVDHESSRPVARGGIRPADAQRASRQQCTLSTPDNPFANLLLSDLADNPGRPPACKYDDHKELIRENFNRGLVRNAYDIYENENSQRQFMTMPNTTAAPDTTAFAQFCYGNEGRKTCKEDPSQCTGAFP